MKHILLCIQSILLLSICLSSTGCTEKNETAPEVATASQQQKTSSVWDSGTYQTRDAYEKNNGSNVGYADESAEIVLFTESRITSPGETVLLPIGLKNALNISTMDFTLTYDPAVLEVYSYNINPRLFHNSLTIDYKRKAGNIYCSFSGKEVVSDIGLLAFIKFKVIAGTASKSFIFISDITAEDTSGKTILPDVRNGIVRVKEERLPGDYNGDGRITELDAMSALKLQGYSKDMRYQLMDVNADGNLTDDDARRILKRSVQARVPLSEDQESIVQDFGWPDSFTIMEIDDNQGQPVRHEVWAYYDGGVTYYFNDGIFQTWQETVCPQKEVIATPYRPDEFIMGVTVEKLECLTNGTEWTHMESMDLLLEGIIEDIDVYVNRQVIAGFYEGRLFCIDAMAVEPEEAG
jgi:hypothetical protein